MDSDFGRAEFLDLSLTEADPIPMSHDRHGPNQWATPSGSPSGIPLRAIHRAHPQAPPSGSPSRSSYPGRAIPVAWIDAQARESVPTRPACPQNPSLGLAQHLYI